MFSCLCFLWVVCVVTVADPCAGGGGSGPYSQCAGSDVLCRNNGVCKKDVRGSYICECPEGYSGKLCQIVGIPRKCVLRCQNEGVCQIKNGKTTCACPDGFSGRRCNDEDIALRCSYFDCYNGGQCNVLEEVPICICTKGFTGRRCQDINYCEDYICYNSGTCRIENGGPTCVCPKQFKGKQCELIL
ncbi:unnamed protein product [Lymnaea stagnalis]|uniref:EGF-like domain-containing protein n=1 Tax=Lymnaea stagnalis TaxID=6523 RepID=A0AAV2IDA0_LYMST